MFSKLWNDITMRLLLKFSSLDTEKKVFSVIIIAVFMYFLFISGDIEAALGALFFIVFLSAALWINGEVIHTIFRVVKKLGK
jgi:hypothetical protein